MNFLVGPSKTKLMCHERLLGFYSEYFDAALFGGFSETTKAETEMPDDDIDEIRTFVSWIYEQFSDSWKSLDSGRQAAKSHIREWDCAHNFV